MSKKTATKKVKYQVPEDKKGSKCGVCGKVCTVPTGYSYPSYADSSYDTQDHDNIKDCIRFLMLDLEEAKSELQDYKDRVRDLEDRSRGYNEYH